MRALHPHHHAGTWPPTRRASLPSIVENLKEEEEADEDWHGRRRSDDGCYDTMVSPIAEDDAVQPKSVSASSTRWGGMFRFLHLSNPYGAGNVLVADPALLWDSGQSAGTASLTFEFSAEPSLPHIAGVAIQHALCRQQPHHHHHPHYHPRRFGHPPQRCRRDGGDSKEEEHEEGEGAWRAIEAWTSSLQPHSIDQFEGVCYDRGWTVLHWPKPLHLRHLTLRFTPRETDATGRSVAVRRVRFLRYLKPKGWWRRSGAGSE